MSWSIRSLEPGPEAPEEFAPGPGSLKRLTDAEFRNSLRDVLGEVTLGDLEPDSLATVEGVRAQAERLLGSVRGRESVGNFATELFRLAIVRGRAKDPERFPSYTLTLQEAMAREVPAMFQSVVFDERAAALDLFTTRRTFVNRELAALYGLDASGLGDESWVPVELPPDGLRAGLLGTAAFLSIYANQKEGSPTLRGKFIRELLLCQPIPDPPPDVSTVIEDPPPGVILTKRERLAAHRSQPVCASCHSAMDRSRDERRLSVRGCPGALKEE